MAQFCKSHISPVVQCAVAIVLLSDCQHQKICVCVVIYIHNVSCQSLIIASNGRILFVFVLFCFISSGLQL